MRPLSGLRELSESYEGYLVDLWGVVHDGSRPFDGVVAALERLAERGARVCFVSNSSRRGEQLVHSLVAMGIARELFVDVVSSGEVTREALLSRDPAVFSALSTQPRVLHLGHPSYVPWLFELPLAFGACDGDVELLVATGTVTDASALDELGARLAPLAARGVPMVCTNPDRLVRGRDGLQLAPGAVAEEYRARGGRTFLYGKPHPPIYQDALRRLGVEPSRVLAVGDMLETDVRGAHNAGLASLWVLHHGVHGLESTRDPSRLDQLCREHGVRPSYVMPRFVW